METPSKKFNTGKTYKTKSGWFVKYVFGQRMVSKDGQLWKPSAFQDRNRNISEMSDRGL